MSDKKQHTHSQASVVPEEEERADGHHGMHAEPAHEHDEHVPSRTAGESRPSDSLAQDDIETNAMHAGHEHAAHEMHADHDHGHGDHAGHDGHGGHAGHEAMFRTRFWVSLILTIPVVLYSHMIQDWFNFSMPMFTGSDWIAPVLGTVVFFYGGEVFLRGGWDELKQRQPGMMLLISLAITVAFVASAATTFGWLDLDYWWELALLVTIMLLGHWMEMRALGETQNALQALAELVPDEAERIVDGRTEIVPASELRSGDLVLVRPGSSVPADGVIREGRAEFDESMITGESRPVMRGTGERIVAGTVVAGSSVRFEVAATGEETTLAGIQRMVEQAQRSKSRAQALADRAAALLFYVAVGAGALTFFIWWLFVDDLNAAITHTVTVLIISCPHALGLAIPLVIAISTEMGAKNGVLIKDRIALERMRTVTTVLFDKTGTLTRGEHAVRDFAPVSDAGDEMLALAAAVEMDSEHPLAKAIVTQARERELKIPVATDFQAISGRGVAAMVDGARISVGGPTMLKELGAQVPGTVRTAAEGWDARGAASLYVVRENEVIGGLALEDEVRDVSREAVSELRNAGTRVVMITGDAHAVANAVGKELGIDEVFAQVLPEKKQSVVKEIQSRGESVAMVGDGVNDAPALAQADVGIAIGAGTDVAIQSAGLVLASSDPRMVAGVRKLSAASYKKMIQNLVWAAGYNIVAIPLAAGVLAPIGVTLSPAMGAVLMSLSTIIVALNAQLLRREDIRPATPEAQAA
jgi:P-type Cu2+ transporter